MGVVGDSSPMLTMRARIDRNGKAVDWMEKVSDERYQVTPA